MSGLLLTVTVEGAAPGKAIGVKEALAMDLEKYGDMRVLRVEVIGIIPEREPGRRRKGVVSYE